jgi:hypothetical protein
MPLAGCKDPVSNTLDFTHSQKNPATINCGIGVVSGIECLIISYISTIKGGATNEISLRKNHRVAEIAEQNRLPCIILMESAGADLRRYFYCAGSGEWIERREGNCTQGRNCTDFEIRQSQVFHSGGSSFKFIARRSKQGIPTISVVFGSSTAGTSFAHHFLFVFFPDSFTCCCNICSFSIRELIIILRRRVRTWVIGLRHHG